MNESAQPKIRLFAALCFCLASVCLVAQLPAVLPPLDSLSESEVHGYTTQIEAAALALRETRAAQWESATAARSRAEGAWQIAKQDSTLDKNTLKALEKAFKDAQSAQKDADRSRKLAKKVYDDAAELASAELPVQRKNAPKIWAQLQKAGDVAPKPVDSTSPEAATPKTKRNKKEKPVLPEKPIADILAAAGTPAQGSTTTNPEQEDKPASKPQKTKKVRHQPDTMGINEPTAAETKIKKPKKNKTRPAVQDSLPSIASEPAADADTTKTKKTRFKKIKKTKNEVGSETPNADLSANAPVADEDARPKLKPGKRPKADQAILADSTNLASRPSGADKRSSPLARYKTYNPAEDVLLNPPTPPCVLAIDTRDEFSGEIQRETAGAELFRHTNPALKNYIKDKSHVICEASIGHAGAQAYLYLTFTVNDPNAPRTLGSLPKSGLAIVKLLDGNILNLYNLHADDGVAGPDGQYWTFRGQYALDRAALRSIRSEELDKIRLAWANGYEDYEVHNVRLLMRLAKCLTPRE